MGAYSERFDDGAYLSAPTLGSQIGVTTFDVIKRLKKICEERTKT